MNVSQLCRVSWHRHSSDRSSGLCQRFAGKAVSHTSENSLLIALPRTMYVCTYVCLFYFPSLIPPYHPPPLPSPSLLFDSPLHLASQSCLFRPSSLSLSFDPSFTLPPSLPSSLLPSPSLTLPPSQLRIRQTEQGNSDTSQRVEVACGAPPVRSVGHRHNGPCSRVQGNGDNSRRPVQTKRALFHAIKPSLWLSG